MNEPAFFHQLEKHLDLEDLTHVNDKKQLINLIAERVEHLLGSQPDLLMSYLYRLDIEERAIKKALNNHEDAVQQLAELIFQRQLQRVLSKRQYKQKPIKGWEW